MKEYQENKEMNFKNHMSPQYIYDLRKNKQMEGMCLSHALYVVTKHGCIPESYYPYNTHQDMIVPKNKSFTMYTNIGSSEIDSTVIFHYDNTGE